MPKILFIFCLIVYICLFGWFWSVDSLLKQTETFLLVYGMINLLYIFLIFLVLKLKEVDKKIALALSLIIGLMLLLIPRADISTDIYTYLWDGWMVNMGINPYLAPPSSELFSKFHSSDLYQLQYWKGELSVYPPLAQFVFALAHFGYSLAGLVGAKIVLAAPFLILSVYLFKILESKLYTLFVLNPLLLFEVYYSAHIDSWMVLFSTLALIYYFKNRYIISSALLGGAIGLKLLPALFLPLMVVDLIKKRRFKAASLYSVITLTLVGFMYWIFYIPGTSFLRPFQNIISVNEFNATIYRYIKEASANHFNLQLSSDLLSIISLGLVGLGILTMLKRKLGYGVLLSVGIIFLLASPTIYPWYLMFLIPLVFLFVNQNKQHYWIFAAALMCLIFGVTYFQQVDFKPYEMKVYISNKIIDVVFLVFLILISVGFWRSKREVTS